MAKTYREVLEEWERAKAFGFGGGLKDYAQRQNELHETTDYNEGLRDGLIPRISTYLDQGLDATGLPAVSEELMGGIGEVFGYEEVGRNIGRSLPRSLINMAPLLIPGAGAGVMAARALGSGALMGLNTFADTGSAAASLVSGAAGAAMPYAGKFGGDIAARAVGAQRYSGELAVDALGRKAGDVLSEIIPTTVGQRAAQYAGSQVGALVPNTASAVYQQRKLNPDQPFDWENFAAETLISQIPFTAYDAVQQVRTPIPTKAQLEGMFKTKEEIQQAKAEAPYTPPPASQDAILARQTLIDRVNRVANDPNISQADKSQALLQAMTNLEQPAPVIDPTKTPNPANELEVTITGRADKIGDSYRVLVDDVESAAQLNIQPGETVFVNGGDVTFDPELNRMVFKTKIGAVKPAKFGLTEKDFGVKATTWEEGLGDDSATNEVNLQARSAWSQLDSDTREALHTRLDVILERKGTVTFQDIPVDITNRIGTGEAATLKLALKTNPRVAIDALLPQQPNLPVQGDPVLPGPDEVNAQADALNARIEEARTRIANRPTITTPEVGALVEMGVPAPIAARLPHGQQVPKSGNLILDMFQGPITADAEGKVVRLGNSDVATDGWMNETRFEKTINLPKGLLGTFKEFYPEAFGERGVNVGVLVKGLQEKPMVEVRKLGDVELNKTRDSIESVQHDLETLGYSLERDMSGEFEVLQNGEPVDFDSLPENVQTVAQRLSNFVDNEQAPVGGAKYSFLGPRDAKDMPGYVEGLVRVPRSTRYITEEDAKWLADYRKRQDSPSREDSDRAARLSNQEVLDIQFNGPHFGSEDTNVLAFFRGYEETLPDGRKAFHIIEQQTDWFKITKGDGTNGIPAGKFGTTDGTIHDSASLAERHNRQRQPLSHVWSELALKAAVDHAREIGADAIMLSDGETAMMTEGHDKVNPKWEKLFTSREAASKFLDELNPEDYGADYTLDGPKITIKGLPRHEDTLAPELLKRGFSKIRPTQEDGMRLHYDRTLPDALAKLTGVKGEKIALPGVHKGAMSEISDDMVNGSLVFRENGKAKTSITGRAFSLEKLKGGLEQDATLSIKEAVMKYEQAQQREAAAREKLTRVPQTPEEVLEIIGDTPEVKAKVNAAVADGATHKQALEEVKFQQVSQEIDGAKLQQKAQTERAKELALDEQAGNDFIKFYTDAATDYPDSDLAPFGEAIKRALEKTSKNQNYTIHVARAVARWQRGGYNNDVSLRKLQSVLNTVFTTAERTSPKTKVSYKVDKEGKRVTGRGGERLRYATKEEAEEALKNLPDALEEGMIVLSDGRKKPFFLGKQVYPLGDVSVDQTTSQDSSTTVGELIASTSLSATIDLTNLPLKTEQDIVRYINEIVNDFDVAENYVKSRFGEAGEEEVLNNIEILTEIREHFQNNPGKEPSREYHEDIMFLLDYSKSSLEHQTTLERSIVTSPFILGSQKLGREMGLLEPTAEKIFRYIAAQKKVLGPIADFVEAQLPVANWNALKLRLPYTEGWHPGGWSFTKDTPVPEINVRNYPTEENMVEWMSAMAHEFVHFNERELVKRGDDVAIDYLVKKAQILETLRNSPALPKGVRELVKRSLREKHWEKLGTDAEAAVIADWRKSLGKDKAYFEYVYAMQSINELTSVLLSNPTAMNIALRTKVPKNAFQSALHWFSNAINKLFGGRPETDNALVDLVSSYDNYLTGGLLRRTYNGFDLIRSELLSRGVHPDALASRLDTIDRVYSRGELQDSIVGFVRERYQGAVSATAEQGELKQTLRTAVISGEAKDVGRETMNLLAEEVPLHQDLYRRMQQDLEIAEVVLANVEDGIIPGNIPEGIHEHLGRSRAKLNAMKRALTKQANALEAWNATAGLTVEGWEQNIRDAFVGKRLFAPPDMPELDSIRAKAGIEKLEGKSVNPLAWNFMLTQHFKELHPAVKAGVQQVSWEQAEARYRAVLLNAGSIHNPDLAASGNSLDRRILDTVNRVKENAAMAEATSDLLRWINKEGGAKGLDLNAPFVKKTLNRFSDKPKGPHGISDRQSLLTTIESIKNRHTVWSRTVLPQAYARLNVAHTATLIMGKEVGMKPEDARTLSAEVYDGLSKLVDPQTAPLGMEQLRMLSAKMQPETYTAALTHAQGLALKLKNALDSIAARPGWVTEQRYGDSKLVMANAAGDKATVSGSLEKLRQVRVDYEKKGYQVVDLIEAEDAVNPRFGIMQDLIQSYEELESQNEVLIRQTLANDPEAMLRVLSLARNSTTIRASIAAAGPMPGPSRRFRTGREHINMIENADQYYVRMNNYLRNKLTRAEVGLEMLHPEIEGNAEYRKYLQQHVDNFLTPDNPIARKIVEATYFAKLGFDVGQAVIEGTQQLTTGMAELVAETGSVTDAFALSARMNKMLVEAHTTKKWANKEHEQLADILQKYGHSGLASWGDIVDNNTHVVLDAARGRTSKVIDKVKTMGAKMSTMVSRYNDQVIAHAAFDLARTRGESFDQAVRTAIDVKQRSLYTSGKAGRSVGFWSIKSRPVPQLLGALTNYTLGWFGQMGVNYVKGFGKNPPKGLTPEQRIGARKAFAYSLVAQVALAGGLGLPGVGQALALFSQITGLDAKGWLRKSLGEMFDEDEEYGGVLTGLALRGVGAAGLPIDPSNRTNVSIPFIGTDAYEGMRLANFAGATASTVADLAEGVAAALQGDRSRAVRALPNALKRPATLWAGEGDIRDNRGGLVMELGMYERAAMMLGLQPSRVSAARDTGEVVRKMNDRAAKTKARTIDSIAELVRKGDVQAAQQALVELRLEDPDLDIQALLQSIANRVSAQSLPYDYRRDLNPAASLAGVGSSVSPTSLRRREIDKEVFRAFGVPLRNNFRADREASQVDALMEQNPFLSLREARETVRGTGPIRRRYTELSLPEYLR